MSEWITNTITNQHIQQYEYSEFENATGCVEGRFCLCRLVTVLEIKTKTRFPNPESRSEAKTRNP